MMAQKIITGCATGHFLHGLLSEGGKRMIQYATALVIFQV